MTEMKKDILQNPELKSNPYSLPEGYMDSLKTRAVKYARPVAVPGKERHRMMRFIISAAATFLLLIAAGALLLRQPALEDGITQEDYLVFSDGYSFLEIYETMEEEQYADAYVSDDDVIEYLIYSGVNENIVEQSK